MLNPNEIIVNEQGYSHFSLVFNDSELEKLYHNGTKKLYGERRRKTLLFLLLQYSLLTIVLLALSQKELQERLAPIAFIVSAFTISLFIYFLALKFEELRFLRKSLSLLFPLWELVSICLILALSQNAAFSSQISLYLLIIAIFFQSEYINSFIKYFLICSLLYLLFVTK